LDIPSKVYGVSSEKRHYRVAYFTMVYDEKTSKRMPFEHPAGWVKLFLLSTVFSLNRTVIHV